MNRGQVRQAGALILLAFMLSACSLIPQPMRPRAISFDESALKPYAVEGDATMTGTACKPAESTQLVDPQRFVLLIPATAYTSEYLQREIIGRETLKPPVDTRLMRYLRTTVVDEAGRFHFARLPAGDYYLTCRNGMPDSYHTRDGIVLRDRRANWMFTLVSVQEGEETTVSETH